MKRNSKILVFILAFTLLIGSAFCFGALADEEPAKKLTVISQNVEYSDTLYLYYAVYPENVDTEGLKLEIYTSNPTGEATPVATVTESTEVTITDTDSTEYVCRAFKSPGIALKDMSTQLYVKAVAADGTESSVRRYSVVEYFNEMSFTTEDEDKSAAYRDMLKAGDAAQLILNHYPNEDANDYASNYKYVTVTDGTLADGFDRGVYLTGTSVTPEYNGSDATNTGWTVENLMTGETEYVAFGSAITLDAHVSLTPTIKPYERGEGYYWNNQPTGAKTVNYSSPASLNGLGGSTASVTGTNVDGVGHFEKIVDANSGTEAFFNYGYNRSELGNIEGANCNVVEFDFKMNKVLYRTDGAGIKTIRLSGSDYVLFYRNAEGTAYSIGVAGAANIGIDEWCNIRIEVYAPSGTQTNKIAKIYVNNVYSCSLTLTDTSALNSRIMFFLTSNDVKGTTIEIDNLVIADIVKTYVAE